MPGTREERIIGWTEQKRKEYLEKRKVELSRKGWALIEFRDNGLDSHASFRRFREATIFEKIFDGIQSFLERAVLALFLFVLFALLAIFFPIFRLLLLIPVLMLLAKAEVGWSRAPGPINVEKLESKYLLSNC